MSQKRSYADIIRYHMKTAENPQNRPLQIRELANAIGYSYEHTRKLVIGEPVSSREMNDLVCTALGLDPEAMWHLAQREKLQRKFKDMPEAVAETVPTELSHVWGRLSQQNRDTLVRMASAMAIAQEQEAFEDTQSYVAVR